MPFKSAKQRKYLFANEPNVAKKFVKKYGSKIKKTRSKSRNRKKTKGK